MKTYMRNGGIAPRILNLGTKMEVRGQLHPSFALTPGTHWIGAAPDAAVRRKSITALTGNRTPVVQPVA
jgi:hypothetical protein